jgi:glycosyltransferase involved in cell wall biosynthesis
MTDVKISIIIITYNQEKVISRTLDSLLEQKEWIYEIVVCDDCSTDANWNVITEYASSYSQLIKTYRNERNLGHIDNWINSWNHVSGNLVYLMAGDDTVEHGLFKKSHELVEFHNIKCDSEKVSLYFDFKIKYPNGKEAFYSNKLVSKGFVPISLKLRGLIWNRTVLYTKGILSCFTPVNKNLGIYSDVLLEFQIPEFSQKIIYEPFIGNVYNYGIGIASKTKTEEHWGSIILILNELERKYNFSKNDQNWIMFKKSYLNFHLKPSFYNLCHTWFNYIKSRNVKYGIDWKNPFRMLKMITRLFIN